MAWEFIEECPAGNCRDRYASGWPKPLQGTEPYLSPQDRELAKTETLRKCPYCGLVWYFRRTPNGGLEPVAREWLLYGKLDWLDGIEMVPPSKKRVRTSGGRRQGGRRPSAGR